MIEYENLATLNAVYRDELTAAFESVLDSGRFLFGPQLTAFEREFADFCRVPHVIGVANGTDALTLILRSLDTGRGGKVVVASNAYIACYMAIVDAGLVPVPVEPDPATYNIDPAAVREAVTDDTVAIMAVHMYGRPCDMAPLVDLSKETGIPLIEDCAQAHGATYRGRTVGSFGYAAAFSFFPTKNLGGLGDGGAVATPSPDVDTRIRRLAFYGFEERNFSQEVGVNSRLDEVQAAFLRIKLRHLPSVIDHKRALAGIYDDELSDAWRKPAPEHDLSGVYHIYPVRHPERDRMRAALHDAGVQTSVHYPLAPHQQPALKHMLAGKSYPISEGIHREIFSLPVSCIHSADDVRRVASTLNALLD